MTLVLCLGNDVLRDDGVGWRVAAELDRNGTLPDGVDVRRSAVAGFYLLDELTGYDTAVVVDAVKTGQHLPGTVLSFPFEDLRSEAGPSPHAVGLPTVMKLGRQSGVPLPGRVHIVAIEVADMETVAEGLTPRVAAAVPAAVEAVQTALRHLHAAEAQDGEPCAPGDG
jgi:hydrogenase maturation protease